MAPEQPTVQTEGSDDFNFMEADEAGPAIEKTPSKSALDILIASKDEDEDQVPEKEEEKTPDKPKKGTLKKEVAKILAATAKSAKEEATIKATKKVKVIATSGNLTPEIIQEARRLAARLHKGLNIEEFAKKYNLVNLNIEALLVGPLDKEGNLI